MEKCKECGHYFNDLCPHNMAQLLSEKLTKEEYNQLVWLVDGDGPAGQFWEALSDKNEQLNPQEYSLRTVSSKEEIAEEE